MSHYDDVSVSSASEQNRLAIVVPSAYVFGGVQTWLDYVVPGLTANGWDVVILLVDGDRSDAARYLSHHPFPRFRRVLNKTGSREGRIRALKASLLEVEPDVVLCVNIVDTYEAVARMRIRHRRVVRVVMAMHSMEQCFFSDVQRYKYLLDGVIVPNRLAEKAVRELRVLSQERIKYAPCGVQTPLREVPCLKEDRLSLIFAGRMDDEAKRVFDLPPVLRALRAQGVNFRLLLAGAGPAEQELRERLSEFEPSVEFMGVVDAKDMARCVYRPGAILLILSPRETGPIVAWEAMANGVVVVTSQFIGIRSEAALVDGVTCLTFAVGDAAAAAAAIVRLQSPVIRNQLANRALAAIQSRYSLSASSAAWSHALRDICMLTSLPPVVSKSVAPPSGRLDRILGVCFAETVREWFGIRFVHSTAGGEWPHTLGDVDDANFQYWLSELDGSNTARRSVA